MPELGYGKSVRKLYDLGRKEYVTEYLPYDVKRDAWMGTLTQDNLVVTGGLVTPGKQLKLLFMRFWSEYTGTTIFKITQTNVGGEVGSAPEGVVDYVMLEAAGAEVLGPVDIKRPVDYVMLEAAGAEVLGPVDIKRPIHVLEGSWTIQIIEPKSADAGASKFGVAWWGVENNPSE